MSSPERPGEGKPGADQTNLASYREIVEQFGPTQFIGYSTLEGEARVLAVLDADEKGQVEIFLDRTPFYAESGGQVGDTGVISTSTGRARVLDTTYALPGLHRHLAAVEDGYISPGQEARSRRRRRKASRDQAQPYRDPPSPLGAA